MKIDLFISSFVTTAVNVDTYQECMKLEALVSTTFCTWLNVISFVNKKITNKRCKLLPTKQTSNLKLAVPQ